MLYIEILCALFSSVIDTTAYGIKLYLTTVIEKVKLLASNNN